MRHLGSLLLSLLLTAAWYVVLGIGLSRFTLQGGYLASTGWKLFFALMLLVAAGIYALLLLPRLSPVGPVLVGLVLIGVGLWALLVTGEHAAFEVLPKSLFGQRYALELPAESGIATFAAVPLLLTVFTPRRWRRHANPVAGPSSYSATPPVPVPLAPAGGYPPPAADPFASPVSPAGSGPEGTRLFPPSGYGPTADPAYGSSSSSSGYGSSGYGSSSGAYPPPSPAAPNYPPPTTYPAQSYPAPSSGAPSYSTPSSGAPSYPTTPAPPNQPPPLWPASPTPDDPESTRPL